jgi:hypothetical protein
LSEAIQPTSQAKAGAVFRWVMFAGLLLSLAANVPGQLSVDSVVALTEARTGVRQTWAPAAASWLLKPFDHLVAGTGLYITASAALLFLSLMSLARLRPRSRWWAPVLGVALILTPQLLIYQGIVWRDVLFANLAIAGFVMIAHAAQGWRDGRRWLPVTGAVVCLALATITRQNGAVLAVAAAGVLAWTAYCRADGRGDWRAAAAWGLGALAAIGLLAFGLNRAAQPPEVPAKLRLNSAALILEHYDVVGAKVRSPRLRFKEIAKADPAAAALLEDQAAGVYSAQRVDTLDANDAYRRTLWHVPDAAMNAQWRRIILHYPAAYLRHRLGVFHWTFLTPDLQRCLPVTVGVTGPAGMLQDLDMLTGVDPQDVGVAKYARAFYDTPVFSHLTWAIVAAAMIGWLLRRRDPADWAMIGLMGGALVFTASFFVISVACDYRYLYLLDVAAMTGALYVALDPPRWRKA